MFPFQRECGVLTRSRFFLPGWATVGALALAGCVGNGGSRPPSASTPPAIAPVPVGPSALELSPNQRLGGIAWIHSEGTRVLLAIDPTVVPPPRGSWVVSRGRDDFAPHAVLAWLGPAGGEFHAARVLAGEPRIGDEVVTPGPELRAWGEEAIQKVP